MHRALQLEAHHGIRLQWRPAQPVHADSKNVPQAAMRTLRIEAGRSDKLRPGDVLGALTGEAGLKADAIGKIDIFPRRAYVAVRHDQAERALAALRRGRIKGRNLRVYRL